MTIDNLFNQQLENDPEWTRLTDPTNWSRQTRDQMALDRVAFIERKATDLAVLLRKLTEPAPDGTVPACLFLLPTMLEDLWIRNLVDQRSALDQLTDEELAKDEFDYAWLNDQVRSATKKLYELAQKVQELQSAELKPSVREL